MAPTTLSIDPTALNVNAVKYLDTTHKLNDYNEIYNLNQHLLDVNTLEEDKLVGFNNQIVTKLMKMKQNYLLTDYAINEFSMYSNILAFTIIIVAFMLVFVAKSTSTDFMIKVCIGFGIFYLLVLMIILKSNANRRKYAWTQYYWDPIKQGSAAK